MKVRVEGATEAAAMLREIGAGRWKKEVGEDYGRQLVAKTKPYPPKPSGSRYRRTMNLSRQWYSTAAADRLTVGNRAGYSGWVQQRSTQAWMHRQHGWPTIEDRFESQYMQLFLQRRVKQAIDAIARKHGATV